MAIDVASEVATLRHMTVSELRGRYNELFDEERSVLLVTDNDRITAGQFAGAC